MRRGSPSEHVMLILVAEVGEPIRSSTTLAGEPVHPEESEFSIRIASSGTRGSHLPVLLRDVAKLDRCDSWATDPAATSAHPS